MPDTLAAAHWEGASHPAEAPLARQPLRAGEAFARRGRPERAVAIGVVAALHGALAAAVLINWVVTKPVQIQTTPVVVIPSKPLEVPPQPTLLDAPKLIQPARLTPVIPPVAVEVAPTAPTVVQTTPPPPPAAPQPAAAEVTQATWEDRLFAHLARYKRYPLAARRQRQQGVAVVRFTIDRAGHVLRVSLERSSGLALLDQEAVAMVQRADPLLAMPAERPGATLELVVPIDFSLRRAG